MTITQDKEVDIFVASTIGSIKHIKYHTEQSKNSKKCIENLVDIKSLTKEDAATCMAWGDAPQTTLLLGRKHQQVEVYSLSERRVTWRCTSEHWGSAEVTPVAGVGRAPGGALVAGLAGGAVRVWAPTASPDAGAERPPAGPLKVLRVSPYDNVYATGGEENDLRVWDLERGAVTFAAKSPPHDWLQLRRPVCVGAAAWGDAPALLAACSPLGYVRLYDARAQRRPVADVSTEGRAAVCLAHSGEREFIVGFARGGAQAVELRSGRLGRGYSGAAGAVTSVAAWGGRLATTSLDRHLTVYDIASKETLHKVYLTSKLRCVLVQTESSTPLLAKGEGGTKVEGAHQGEELEADLPDDLDTLFDTMDTVGDKPKKRKAEAEAEGRATPSTAGSTDDGIRRLLQSTERQRRRRDRRKRDKRAKSLFHNA